MILHGHLTTIVWLTSTYLTVCEASPAEELQQRRYNEGQENVPYSGAERIYSTSSQQPQYPQVLHHRSRGHKMHAQSNNSHQYAFKLHSTKRHDVNNVGGDNNYVHFSSETSNKKAVNERTEGPTRRKRGDGRKRKKKEERKGRRKPQGNSGWGSDVDDVLAALVGYSKDPSLWRFVHSVVAELDYSKQASESGPPSRHHYSVNRFNTWSPKETQNSATKGKHRKQNNNRWQHRSGDGNNESYGGEGGDGDIDRGGGKDGNGDDDVVRNLTYDSNPRGKESQNTERNSSQHIPIMHNESVPQASQFLDQNTQELFHASLSQLEQPRESPAIRSSTKIEDTSGMKPTHTPHFIFHKVYIDTNYDPHTGQPYHRPVLAVKAVAGEKTKTSSLGKDNDNGHSDSMDALAYQLPDDASRELPDKLEDLLAQQQREDQELTANEKENEVDKGDVDGGELEDDDEENQNQYYRRTLTDPLYGRDQEKDFLRKDLQRDWSEDDDRAMEESFDGEGWREVSNRRRHRRHFLHRLRQLQSFESQIKFLRRWQERLIRKRSQWSTYYPTTVT